MGGRSASYRLAPPFRQSCGSREPVLRTYTERTNDIVRAVGLLRKHGVAVGFPMQTADGEVIFSVGKNSTLTADQMLELLERGELDADGVRRICPPLRA